MSRVIPAQARVVDGQGRMTQPLAALLRRLEARGAALDALQVTVAEIGDGETDIATVIAQLGTVKTGTITLSDADFTGNVATVAIADLLASDRVFLEPANAAAAGVTVWPEVADGVLTLTRAAGAQPISIDVGVSGSATVSLDTYETQTLTASGSPMNASLASDVITVDVAGEVVMILSARIQAPGGSGINGCSFGVIVNASDRHAALWVRTNGTTNYQHIAMTRAISVAAGDQIEVEQFNGGTLAAGLLQIRTPGVTAAPALTDATWHYLIAKGDT